MYIKSEIPLGFLSYILILVLNINIIIAIHYDDDTFNYYKTKVKGMFDHSYTGYLEHAYPLDELKPITCQGEDTWGSYSLTLIDSLDTLVVLGNYTEFQRVVNLLLKNLDFNKDLNVSVFETNIRVVGGLLAAHLQMRRAGMVVEDGWPCTGPLLRLAEQVARKLLPAFETPTGMPYGTVNLLHGVPKGETPVTCTACIGTFLLEFGALTHLTGAQIFLQKALQALEALWAHRSPIGLVGNHIDVLTGKWVALDASIGAAIDSYFEYLVKGGILFSYPDLIHMFHQYRASIDKHLRKDDWYMWVNMDKGSVTQPLFQSLEAYWPGLLSMVGDVDGAMKSLLNYHQVWKQYGFTPEFYNIPKNEAHPSREGYPLRPELIESIWYLYRSTGDPYLVGMAIDIVESIEHSCKTSCGYATVKDSKKHSLDDRMESFFLSETLKYLYLMFDRDNFVNNDGSSFSVVNTTRGKCVLDAGGYIFNTEAHFLDPASLYCCSSTRQEDASDIRSFSQHINLSKLISDYPYDFIPPPSDYQLIKGKNKTSIAKYVVEEVEIVLDDDFEDVCFKSTFQSLFSDALSCPRIYKKDSKSTMNTDQNTSGFSNYNSSIPPAHACNDSKPVGWLSGLMVCTQRPFQSIFSIMGEVSVTSGD